VDQSFSQAAQSHWDLNFLTVDDPCVTRSFQTIAFKRIRLRSTSLYHSVRIDSEITVLQLQPPHSEKADVLSVREQCMGRVLLCDCTPFSHARALTPVWGHTVALLPCTLQQKPCARHTAFESNEEVMLCPTIFSPMCQNLGVQPDMYLFALHCQHQLPRYYTVDPATRTQNTIMRSICAGRRRLPFM